VAEKIDEKELDLEVLVLNLAKHGKKD